MHMQRSVSSGTTCRSRALTHRQAPPAGPPQSAAASWQSRCVPSHLPSRFPLCGNSPRRALYASRSARACCIIFHATPSWPCAASALALCTAAISVSHTSHRSLQDVARWYGHAATHVLLVNAMPEGRHAQLRPFDERGWCFFEEAAASLLKTDECLREPDRFTGGETYSEIYKQLGRPRKLR